MFKSIVIAAISALLGIVGTLFIQNMQENKIKVVLHRKLFEEIKYNATIGAVMETTGNFKKFKVDAWDNFVGTNAFYDLPMSIRRPLDSYYMTFKWFNEGMLKWKKLADKEKDELTVEDLNKLVEPYTKFLFDKKILDMKNFADIKP